jgi:hypothetical protein
MTELLFDEDETRTVWATPDPSGVTLRTQFKGTQGVLDRTAATRTPRHARVNTKGAAWHKVADIPMELYEKLTIGLGRPPTAEELVGISQMPEFKMLSATEKRLSVTPEARAVSRVAEDLLRKGTK